MNKLELNYISVEGGIIYPYEDGFFNLQFIIICQQNEKSTYIYKRKLSKGSLRRVVTMGKEGN